MKLLRHLIRIRGHTLCNLGRNPGSVLVDAGAHRGQFSAEIKARYGCSCWLVEANPLLAQSLLLAGVPQVLNVALAGADGMATFVFRENPEAGGILPSETDESGNGSPIEMVSLGTLMERIGVSRLDLLKLDIEGAEFDLIQKTPDRVLQSIDQITVEFHDFLPEMSKRGLFEQARKRLVSLGFSCSNMAFRTHGDVMFLNRKTCGLNGWQIRTGAMAARWVMKMLGRVLKLVSEG